MNLDPDRVPENLSMAIAIFIAGLSDVENATFRALEENRLAVFYVEAGAQLREIWSLWQVGTPLVLYFHKLKVNDPYDISSIVIQAAWRVLNNKPLAAEDLLRPYQKP